MADQLITNGGAITLLDGSSSFTKARNDTKADIVLLVFDGAASATADSIEYGLASERVGTDYQLNSVSVSLGEVINNSGGANALMHLTISAEHPQRYHRDRSRSLLATLDSLSKESAESDYNAMLKSAKANPAATDFLTLRALYAQSGSYSALRHMRPEYKKHLVAAGKAINSEKNYPKALEHCSAILEGHFIDVEGHYWCMKAYEGMGDREQAAYHHKFTNGLVQSLFVGGDGYCPEYPISIVDLSEEFALIYLSGNKRGTYRSIKSKESLIDYYTATSFRDGKKRNYFFNANVILRSYQK